MKLSPSTLNRNSALRSLASQPLLRSTPLIHNVLCITVDSLLNGMRHAAFFNIQGHVSRRPAFIRTILKGAWSIASLRSCFTFHALFIQLILTFSPIHVFGHSASPSLGLNHSKPRGIIKYLVQTSPYAILSEDFYCPAGSAMSVLGEQAGAFVTCEDWNEYQALMQVGRTDAANELLLTAPPRNAERIQAARDAREKRLKSKLPEPSHGN